MKLEKAIEITTQHLYPGTHHPDPDLDDALKLLIEAGKQIKLDRQNRLPYPYALLPGETEE